VSFNEVEFTMPRSDMSRRADFLDLILTAAKGVFPGPALEALIARMEAGR
jgi:hypothetical protein